MPWFPLSLNQMIALGCLFFFIPKHHREKSPPKYMPHMYIKLTQANLKVNLSAQEIPFLLQ